MGKAEIKRVHRIPAVNDLVGVAINVEINLVAVVRNEGHGEANVTNLPTAVIGLLEVEGRDLKHVARASGAVRSQPGFVLRQASQDAPQKDVLWGAGAVGETSFATNDRDWHAERERGAAGVRKSAQNDGAEPAGRRNSVGSVLSRRGPLPVTRKFDADHTR